MNADMGGDLFIVDNADDGWTGLRYLEEWTDIATSFDIATGYFDVGSLLALDGKWQQLDKIRILMGVETTSKTRNVIRKTAEGKAVAILGESLDNEKRENPLLEGVPGIVDAIKNGRIEIRIYSKDKFHAKAYITHSKLDVIGSQALVGSSNFTRPGLSHNVELNLRIEASNDVEDLQRWFESYWEEAEDAANVVVAAIERHVQLFTPFDVYAKALHELLRGKALTADEWDKTKSLMFPQLDRYQQEAYGSLMKITQQHGGAFLCDGVGLGKTFVGLMLIERLVLQEGKRVLLLAPKGAREGVWDPHLDQYLPHIGGLGASDFSNLAIFNHTDLTRKGEYPERFKRLASLADAVIIDEAHHFRNPGRKGDPERGIEPSRYRRLYDLLDPDKREKQLFLLTATPINNSLADFRHMAELFTRVDESYFRGSIGINNLRSHFIALEHKLQASLEDEHTPGEADIAQAEEILEADTVFKELVVQRSRAYAVASQKQESGDAAMFPERKPPQVAEYSIKQTYGDLLEIFEKAFEKKNPLFTLPMYYPLHWYTGPDEIDPSDVNRQKQIVGLIRTQFLKRFESSVKAFEISCDRLLKKMLAFVDVNSETDTERRDLEKWLRQNETVIRYAHGIQLELWGDATDADDYEEDVVPPEMLEAVEKLDRDDYNIAEILKETYFDMNEIVKFLDETRRFEVRHDDKIQKLVRLLKTKKLKDQKMLIFTEFTDTARYIAGEFEAQGITGVEQIDGDRKIARAGVIQRFAPYYNRSSSPQLAVEGKDEIRILISTDVLSEGLNLQDGTRMINYDIHWNPVRLMQRIGRVDRRLNPEIERQMIADHPDLAKQRGVVEFWNFLPPDELNRILSLYKTVTRKTLLISKTLGIEGKKLLRPEDDFAALREFNHAYEGEESAEEQMRLEYRDLIESDPGLVERLDALPEAIHSGRTKHPEGKTGVFFCYSLSGLDRNEDEFTYEAGTTAWYFAEDGSKDIASVPAEIVGSIHSTPADERSCKLGRKELVAARKRIERHIRNSYEKRLDVPQDAPKPKLRSRMEVHGGSA